jgi:hypothetical protein
VVEASPDLHPPFGESVVIFNLEKVYSRSTLESSRIRISLSYSREIRFFPTTTLTWLLLLASTVRLMCVFSLTENMRLHQSNAQWYTDFLLAVGNGTIETDSQSRISLPSAIETTSSIERVINRVYLWS